LLIDQSFSRPVATLPQPRAGRLARLSLSSAPPPVLLIFSILSVQIGSALGKDLFGVLGPTGTVFVRVGSGALVMLLLGRLRWRAYTAQHYRNALLFGLTLAAMNYSFYQAISRLPLGIAVAVEFLGPLSVALVGARRPLDVMWVMLAGGGVFLLAPWSNPQIALLGLIFALLAAALWAAYIILTARMGQLFSGNDGLTLAMGVAALALVPVGAPHVATLVAHPIILLAGVGVGLLSSVIPYLLEMEALRRMPTRVFGVMMSLEPVFAAVVGFIFLSEGLGWRALAAIALISSASAGISWTNDTSH
jgi:inner membrane transporter RhtA